MLPSTWQWQGCLFLLCGVAIRYLGTGFLTPRSKVYKMYLGSPLSYHLKQKHKYIHYFK